MIKDSFIAATLALVVFILIYLPLEFQITEAWMLTAKISPVFGIIFLASLVGIFASIDWLRFTERKLFWVFLATIILMAGFVYKEYRQQKLSREYLPKIYRMDREWGIQAQIIKIYGVNFFPPWKKGKVMVDNQEFLVRSWDEKLVVAEQQVPVKFGRAEIYLVRSDSIISNKVPFEIKNPKYLGL